MEHPEIEVLVNSILTLNFALMAERLWNYKSGTPEGNQTLYYFQSKGHSQAMAFDQEGNLKFHCIESTSEPGWVNRILEETGLKEAFRMQIEEPFLLSPKAFRTSTLNVGSENGSEVLLSSGLYLKLDTPLENTSHGVAALLSFGQTRSKQSNFTDYVLLMNHGRTLILLLFHQGTLHLANSYPVSNEAEMLYFAVAAAKSAGVSVDKLEVEMVADTGVMPAVKKTFDRFLPHFKEAPLQLPYEDGAFPPFLAETWLLYQFSKCVSPVEN